MRALYGLRSGRVVFCEAVNTADVAEQRRLARDRLKMFDQVEVWDTTVLVCRLTKTDADPFEDDKIGL